MTDADQTRPHALRFDRADLPLGLAYCRQCGRVMDLVMWGRSTCDAPEPKEEETPCDTSTLTDGGAT